MCDLLIKDWSQGIKAKEANQNSTDYCQKETELCCTAWFLKLCILLTFFKIHNVNTCK